MIITHLDNPITAEEARQISLTNKDDSRDRQEFRTLMNAIHGAASVGYTRYQSLPHNMDWTPSDHVCKALRSMGYTVTIKRAYIYDEKKKGWSDQPWLDSDKRDQYIVEVTWG